MKYFIPVFLVLFIYAPVSGQTDSMVVPIERLVTTLVEQSPVFGSAAVGFALYDPAADTFMCTSQADRFYVPASNQKLLTLFLSNRLLRDGMTVAAYRKRPGGGWDVWPQAYPLCLHPDFRDYDELTPWLAKLDAGPIYLHLADQPPRYGSGWCWDDYNGGYMTERSLLPLYGNRAWFNKEVNHALTTLPDTFARRLVYESTYEGWLERDEYQNTFTFGPRLARAGEFEFSRGVAYGPELIGQLLTDTLGREIRVGKLPLPGGVSFLRVPVPDTLYRAFMKNSDNYLGEQLLLACSAARYGKVDIDKIVEYAEAQMDGLLGNDRGPQWVDGSGLSRYNLVSPRQLIFVLDSLLTDLGEERLFSILPTGGRDGTLRRRYAGDPEPYVFAKTGTLSNTIALSGGLRCRSGRLLLFSLLINNATEPTTPYYQETERLLRFIRDSY